MVVSVIRLIIKCSKWCAPRQEDNEINQQKNISICLQITIMLFHRCQSAKVTLETFRVVVMDITANHFHQFSTIRETLSIITLSLQDAPKSFHRAIVNAAANTRHTLYHASIDQPLVEVSVGILKSTVTVEDRMRIRISLDCLCKSVEHKFVVVCIPNRKGNKTSVISVKDIAQRNFLHSVSFVILEFRHICQPLFVWLFCMKFPVQNVFRVMLWCPRMSGAAYRMKLNG